ncbi:sugar phosphate isomerase/epimerase family protein [Alkalicoccobacillus porphyridii]|uniref:Sugar phosphate isomerase/epimerase n=1 Tax=Alkalicoccobacillus porphyridii TaxID=2597270 RepID=A0A553ZV93_9BACI|nr:sugar phosphate isomerase/epimerase family protein [Alkalicoccobacillus porphyridii]TSB45343.1 sugar phosphate isomerase/epimerase [Alkalicoccobacillus porphyridii]
MMPFLSLNTFSLQNQLGPVQWTSWDEQAKTQIVTVEEQPENYSLLELPFILKDRGFDALEVCHFHIPSTNKQYLEQLRSAFQDADLRFYSLLVDYGDISNEDATRREKDIEWVKQWIDSASIAGAEHIRIIAGEADPSDKEALDRALDNLKQLADYAAEKGVKVLTENFRPLASTMQNCLSLIDQSEGKFGLTTDFGNYEGPNKYESLRAAIPLSSSIHAKARTSSDGSQDLEEFQTCMDIMAESQYDGAITLVYNGAMDDWQGIDEIKRLSLRYVE